MLNIFCRVVLVNKLKVSEKNFPGLGTEIISIYWNQNKKKYSFSGERQQIQL